LSRAHSSAYQVFAWRSDSDELRSHSIACQRSGEFPFYVDVHVIGNIKSHFHDFAAVNANFCV
jgi:hypothetical protein